jgi:hypothetical protein
MYLLISLMLHVKHHKNYLNLCECLVKYKGIWSQQLHGLRMRLGLHFVYYCIYLMVIDRFVQTL